MERIHVSAVPQPAACEKKNGQKGHFFLVPGEKAPPDPGQAQIIIYIYLIYIYI